MDRKISYEITTITKFELRRKVEESDQKPSIGIVGEFASYNEAANFRDEMALMEEVEQ